jgi:hypothetical protein
MHSDMRILMEFLGQTGADVSGRLSPEPQGETTILLERFARGECSPEERDEVCRLLRSNPAWLRWLSDRVRDARENPSRSSVD